jgi:hypothetical protein
MTTCLLPLSVCAARARQERICTVQPAPHDVPQHYSTVTLHCSFKPGMGLAMARASSFVTRSDRSWPSAPLHSVAVAAAALAGNETYPGLVGRASRLAPAPPAQVGWKNTHEKRSGTDLSAITWLPVSRAIHMQLPAADCCAAQLSIDSCVLKTRDTISWQISSLPPFRLWCRRPVGDHELAV